MLPLHQSPVHRNRLTLSRAGRWRIITGRHVCSIWQDANVRSSDDMAEVRRLLSKDLSSRAVAERTGVPFGTVQRWRQGTTATFGAAVVPTPGPWRPEDPAIYAYLLGLYLGDGHVNVARTGGVHLRVCLDAAYPGIVASCRSAMEVVSRRRTQVLLRDGWNMRIVQCGWKRWPEALPQHGAGRKHTRPIELEPWQRHIVNAHPDWLVRGLIHSDGCRTVNRFTTSLPSGRVAEHAYPRYFFTNLSADIRRLFCDACDLLGVRWTQSSFRNISVADRRSVALLDRAVGPKA